VVEADNGALYMIEKFVKASGAGVCAAPPAGDPAVAAATMGQMQLTDLTGPDAGATRFHRSAQLDIRHPQLDRHADEPDHDALHADALRQFGGSPPGR
jgi:sulfur-oxidizing protein SoxY